MFPVLGTNMSHYTSSSAGYPGSSAYTVPDQPPFTSGLSRQHSQWRPSAGATPTMHSPNPSSPQSNSRKSSFFSLRNTNTRSSTSSSTSSRDSLLNSPTWSERDNASNLSRHSSTASTSSSLTSSIKSIFHRSSDSAGESRSRAEKKADKARRKRNEVAEKDAYRRAQDMEATAMYMAWSMF